MKKNGSVLGVDVGYVIMDLWQDDSLLRWESGEHLSIPIVDGAVRALQCLVYSRFGEHVHLVSRVDEGMEAKIRAWLEHHCIFRLTSINPRHLHFCAGRADKAPICERLGITYFVDDRVEVLGHMSSVPNRYLFRGRSEEITNFPHFAQGLIRVEDWREARDAILA